MSKSAVPDVYSRVIKDVCELSRQDFEEGGVDLGALELLQQGWQTRLTNTHIAAFPWDPKPEPVQKTDAPPAPSVKPLPATLPSNGAALTPPSSHSTPGPHIKQENQQYATQQPMAANYATQGYPGSHLTAEHRASMHLQERFGPQAAPQIAQLQGQRLPPQPNVQPHNQQPYIKQEFKQEDVSNHNYPSQNYNQPLRNSQVDGAGDARAEYDSEIKRRRALVAQHRGAADQLIRDRVLASQRELEAGGLMLPLDEQVPTIARREPRKSNKSSLARTQGDAAGDEDEDEDAINSDLDDPDELDDTAADDENVANMMLCTYDKVQRVKNKWKCTLKDGILSVDGAEFVFHKGQGEFEW